MPQITAELTAENRWVPKVDGQPLNLKIATKGFYRKESALRVAQKIVESGIDYVRIVPKFSFPEPEPITYAVPDPQPEPDYSCMGPTGHRMMKVDVNLFHQADPQPTRFIGYEQPDVFDQSKSKGSSPVICCPNDEVDLSPAEVTSIRLVRLIEAQRQYEMTAAMRKVDVNLDPEADGHYAAQVGRQRKSCPWTKAHNPTEAAAWYEGFDSYDGVER